MRTIQLYYSSSSFFLFPSFYDFYGNFPGEMLMLELFGSFHSYTEMMFVHWASFEAICKAVEKFWQRFVKSARTESVRILYNKNTDRGSSNKELQYSKYEFHARKTGEWERIIDECNRHTSRPEEREKRGKRYYVKVNVQSNWFNWLWLNLLDLLWKFLIDINTVDAPFLKYTPYTWIVIPQNEWNEAVLPISFIQDYGLKLCMNFDIAKFDLS